MRGLIVCLFICISYIFCAKAEIIIINGDTTHFSVKKSSLEQHPDIAAIRKFLVGYETGKCFDCDIADYIAEWTVIGNSLYLTGIYPGNSNRAGEKADINKIFRKGNSRVKADWVNAEFWIPVGKSLRSHDIWAVYGAELYLVIKNGLIVKRQDLKYPTARRLEPNEMQQFIYSGIQWEKIPNLGNEQKRLFITFEAGDSGKPENVVLQRKTDCLSCNEEALRMLSLMPWPADYREGKILPLHYIISIIFSEEQRKKYVH